MWWVLAAKAAIDANKARKQRAEEAAKQIGAGSPSWLDQPAEGAASTETLLQYPEIERQRLARQQRGIAAGEAGPTFATIGETPEEMVRRQKAAWDQRALAQRADTEELYDTPEAKAAAKDEMGALWDDDEEDDEEAF